MEICIEAGMTQRKHALRLTKRLLWLFNPYPHRALFLYFFLILARTCTVVQAPCQPDSGQNQKL